MWVVSRTNMSAVDGEGGRVGILQNLGKRIMSATLGVAERKIKFRLR